MATEPYVPPRSRRSRWILRVLALAVVAAVGAAVTLVVLRVISDKCADGVSNHHGECVGVTDGSYHFLSELGNVSAKIKDQNDWVNSQETPAVSIAYVMPISRSPDSITSIASFRRALVGAYTAQYEANHGGSGKNTPLVRLLISSTGTNGELWQPVVDELTRRVDSSDRLVAVAGMGPSLETTVDAIERLSQDTIPVAAATMTADNLPDLPNLVRVAPTNKQQVDAAVQFLRDQGAVTALVVQDTRPGDRYVSTLGDPFRQQFESAGGRLVEHVEEYNSELGGARNAFQQMAPNICVADPDAIYFAGRATELRDFIAALAGRQCAQDARTGITNPVSVVAGDDATQLLAENRPAQGLADSGIRLYHTALAHPGSWDTEPNQFLPASIRPFREEDSEFNTSFPDESLADGEVIMAHDAVSTTVTAIRSVAGQGNDVSPGDIVQQWRRINGMASAQGASGRISLDNAGLPTEKVIPILEVEAGGGARFETLVIPR